MIIMSNHFQWWRILFCKKNVFLDKLEREIFYAVSKLSNQIIIHYII